MGDRTDRLPGQEDLSAKVCQTLISVEPTNYFMGHYIKWARAIQGRIHAKRPVGAPKSTSPLGPMKQGAHK